MFPITPVSWCVVASVAFDNAPTEVFVQEMIMAKKAKKKAKKTTKKKAAKKKTARK